MKDKIKQKDFEILSKYAIWLSNWGYDIDTKSTTYRDGCGGCGSSSCSSCSGGD